MALATQADVEARLGRDLTDAEAAGIADRLDDASAVVVGYAGRSFEPAPYPSAVVGVVAKMVARSLTAADSVGFVTQQNAGPFSVSYNGAAATGDVWLTAADKLALRPHRRGGGLSSVQLVGERYEIRD